MKFQLLVFIVAIAESVAESLYTSSLNLYPSQLVSAGTKPLDRSLETRLSPTIKRNSPRSKDITTNSENQSRTIFPRGNCAGKPRSPKSSADRSKSDQLPHSRKSGALSFSLASRWSKGLSFSRKKSGHQEALSRQSSSDEDPPGSRSVIQNNPMGPSRTQHIQRANAKVPPIPYPNFIRFDKAAAHARPSRDPKSKEMKNPSKDPMSMRFTVHGPGSVSLTSEHENSHSTESHEIKKGESMSRDIQSKYGTRIQGTTETGAQFDLAAQRAYMGLNSHQAKGSIKSKAWGPDEFSREETIEGKGTSEVDLKSHANQQHVGMTGTLKGKGGFHAHSNAGIPLE